jgi:hypothetical protein
VRALHALSGGERDRIRALRHHHVAAAALSGIERSVRSLDQRLGVLLPLRLQRGDPMLMVTKPAGASA